jgi:serine protease Do
MILFIVLSLINTLGLEARGTASSSDSQKDTQSILRKVSPGVVKVLFDNHKRYVASGVAIDRQHVLCSLSPSRFRFVKAVYVKTDKNKLFPARIVGHDPQSRMILLSISEKILTPAKLSNESEVGEWVALVGAFYSKFPSIYQGIVSSASTDELLLNAPVVPGSAGGAVVNKKGELLGVIVGRFGFASGPNYVFKDYSGELYVQGSKSINKDLCYALPTAKAMDIANDLKKYGRVRKGWLGVTMDSDGNVVKISSVVKNSPAAKAGLHDNDQLLKIGNKSIKSTMDVMGAVRDLKPEQKVKVEVNRNGVNRSLLVVMGDAHRDRKVEVQAFKTGKNGITVSGYSEIVTSLPQLEHYTWRISSPRSLGLEAMTLTPELAREFKIKEGAGLMISKIEKNSAAEKAGFRPADIIVKVANTRINKNEDLRRILSNLEDNEAVLVEFKRKGETRKIKVVPQKSNEFDTFFNRFRNRMLDVKSKVEEENHIAEEEIKRRNKQRQLFFEKEKTSMKDKELERYKHQLELMRKEQQKLQMQLKEVMKLLKEKQKKEKEKKKQ